MGTNFDFQRKFHKSKSMWDAGMCLIGRQHYRQAAVMFWMSVRDKVFGWLEMKQKEYDSTRKALTLAVSDPELAAFSAQIMFVYTIGTMAEWDENFYMTSEQTYDYKQKCEEIIEFLNR